MLNPLLQPELRQHRFDFSSIRPEHFEDAFTTLLPQVQAEHEEIATTAPLEFYALFDSAEKTEQLNAVVSLLNHLTSVVDNKALRAVHERWMPEISRAFQTMAFDERLYWKIKDFAALPKYHVLSPMYQKMVKELIKGYEQGGIHLPDDKKARMTDIGARMGELAHNFECNLQDFTNEATLAFSVDDLKGVPARTLQNALVLPDGTLDITMVSGGFEDIMEYCEVESTRKTVYEYLLNHGVADGMDNRPVLAEILGLRTELVALLGYDSYAAMSLEDDMAGTPQVAQAFTENLARLALPKARAETAALEAFGEKLLNRPVQFWDWGYVAEAYQKSYYRVDTEALRAYFPVSQVIEGLFALVERLYGVKFEQNTSLSVWHKDVTAWNVIDKNTGHLRGTLYLDLFKRKHKDDGAWMNEVSNRHVSNGETRLPVVYIVCNAPKDKKRTSTFTFDEITTLFHEMGHALHNLLTEVDEEFFSGSAHVQHDAVELPSQFMENFCWDFDVVRSLSTHIETGEALPQSEFDKLYASRLYLAASGMLRTARYALMDMALHMTPNPDATSIEEEILSTWCVRERDPRGRTLPSFSHIFAGGYAAGYYAYQWAEMLSADAFAALREAGNTRAEQRSRMADFRQHILATGGVDDMSVNFERFRGRAPDVRFLLADHGIIDYPESV